VEPLPLLWHSPAATVFFCCAAPLASGAGRGSWTLPKRRTGRRRSSCPVPPASRLRTKCSAKRTTSAWASVRLGVAWLGACALWPVVGACTWRFTHTVPLWNASSKWLKRNSSAHCLRLSCKYQWIQMYTGTWRRHICGGLTRDGVCAHGAVRPMELRRFVRMVCRATAGSMAVHLSRSFGCASLLPNAGKIPRRRKLSAASFQVHGTIGPRAVAGSCQRW